MSEVPDHLIDAAARAIKATMVSESSFASVTEEARAAILAVADELREEGARAERERIADTVKTMLGCMSRTPENQWSRACMTELLAAIREEARRAS